MLFLCFFDFVEELHHHDDIAQFHIVAEVHLLDFKAFKLRDNSGQAVNQMQPVQRGLAAGVGDFIRVEVFERGLVVLPLDRPPELTDANRQARFKLCDADFFAVTAGQQRGGKTLPDLLRL